jgi:ABC-type nitrate/sulfonate/bicarbonate transport system permease component
LTGFVLAFVASLPGFSQTIIRVGAFPNITHVQAMVGMPKIYGMAGRNLGAGGFQLFWHVRLPASLPFIVSGLMQGWAFAWRSLITAEMLYLSLGLGQVLMMERDFNDMSAVIAVMILIIAVGYARRWVGVQVHGESTAAQVGIDKLYLE